MATSGAFFFSADKAFGTACSLYHSLSLMRFEAHCVDWALRDWPFSMTEMVLRRSDEPDDPAPN
jgi:hypothetical protein